MSRKLFFFSVLFLVLSIFTNTINLLGCLNTEKTYSDKVIATLTSENTNFKEDIGPFNNVIERASHFYNFTFTHNGNNFECSFIKKAVPLWEQASLCNNDKTVLLVNPDNPANAIFSHSLEKIVSIIFIILPICLLILQYYINKDNKYHYTKEIIIRRQNI